MYDPALSIPLAGCKKKKGTATFCYLSIQICIWFIERLYNVKKKIQHDWTIENSNNQNFI